MASDILFYAVIDRFQVVCGGKMSKIMVIGRWSRIATILPIVAVGFLNAGAVGASGGPAGSPAPRLALGIQSTGGRDGAATPAVEPLGPSIVLVDDSEYTISWDFINNFLAGCPPLQWADQGPCVEQVQTALAYLGYLPKRPADGLYGRDTTNAVYMFQLVKNLPRDGQVGPVTANSLKEEVRNEYIDTMDPGIYGTTGGPLSA
jgi:Putative peptidoglycan binding domain